MDVETLSKKLAGVQALMEKAGTPGEAEAAALAFRRLLTKYNLSEREASQMAGVAGTSVRVYTYEIKGDSLTIPWKSLLLNVLATYNYCESYLSQPDLTVGSRVIIGESFNVSSVVKIYETMVPVFEALAGQAYEDLVPDWVKEDPVTLQIFHQSSPGEEEWKLSYLMGVHRGLQSKYIDERTQESEEVGALVLVKKKEIDEVRDSSFDSPEEVRHVPAIREDRGAWAEGYWAGREYDERRKAVEA